MKYKLPRQALTRELKQLLYKEMKKQRFGYSRLSKKHWKEIQEISQIIETQELPCYLICRKLKFNLGSGIFLHPKARPILRGQVIAPYAGEASIVPSENPDDGSYAFMPIEGIKLSKEQQALFDPESSYNPKRKYSFKVDGLKKGNFTRFINHSDEPNVVARLVRVPGGSSGLEAAPIEVVYFAKRNIHPGEQLLVSYEDGEESYWKVFKIKPFAMTSKTFQLNKALKVVGID